VGDGVQQVYPADLRRAAQEVHKALKQFESDMSTFKNGMCSY
jgi:hypothetical protein